jgi:hypothetical protein
MADTIPIPQSSALVLADIVRLILAALRLMALVLEHSAQVLDSSMQHVAATTFQSSEQVASPEPVMPETSQPRSVYSDMTPSNPDYSTAAGADVESSGVQEEPTIVRRPPVPIFCDPKSKSRQFYCITVGRLVGVFDNR